MRREEETGGEMRVMTKEVNKRMKLVERYLGRTGSGRQLICKKEARCA